MQISKQFHPPVHFPAGQWLDFLMQRLRNRKMPQLFKQKPELDGFEIGYGLLNVIGAPPGEGKTALAMKILFDGLELNPHLNAIVANAEMGFDTLLQRQLTRLTGIDSSRIRFGKLSDEEIERCNEEAEKLMPSMGRVGVLHGPYNVMTLWELLAQVTPGLLVVDYIQKFAPPDKDARQGVNGVMTCLRAFALSGWAVLCLSATKRDSSGRHDPKQLSLSSFRESSEVEYNADSAYVIVADKSQPGRRIAKLQHVKNRHGELKDHHLLFDPTKMEFLPADVEQSNQEKSNFFGGKN